MMVISKDKLSNLAALRPLSSSGVLRPRRPNQAESLAALVAAECRTNKRGSHLVTRNSYTEPKAGALREQALRLLVPNATGCVLDMDKWTFLDTETTGLAGGSGTYAFLVGIGWWSPEGFTVEQFFMRDHGDEASILLEVSGRLQERPVLITFNGKSYDWPLLETRYRMTRSDFIPQPKVHIDMLHPARRLWRLRLKSVTLAELERHILGRGRENDIPSSTIPQRYFDFLRGGRAEPIAEVFLHNRMDLCGLAVLAERIMDILETPEADGRRPEELFGVSRLLQHRGENHRASRIFEQAIALGLPEMADRVARRELALFARRRRDFQQANGLWESLAGGSSEGLQAYEQLAIHYEHRLRNPAQAASLTREALARLREEFTCGRIPLQSYRKWHQSLQHRLNRLEAKFENRNPEARVRDLSRSRKQSQ